MNNFDQVRELYFYRNYFETFYQELSDKAKRKVDHVLFVLTHAQRIPEKFFKHLEGTQGLYEARIKHGSNIYRIFCCFDEGKLIVLLNGFQKKTDKTPKTEITLALKLMHYYHEEKSKNTKK